jgi:glucarate dehydratase
MSRALRTHVSRTIVEIETDRGLVGIGETRGEWSAPLIRDRFAGKLIGRDVADRRGARDACLLPHVDYGFPELQIESYAFAGIEMALMDLLAKQAGVPLYQFLGGAVRERAPFVAYAYTVDPAEGHSEREIARIMAGIAKERVAASGASMFEFKIGRHSLACDIATTHAIRDALGPDIDLTVDVNMGFTLDQARRYLAGVAAARLVNVEEPTPELGDYERLRNEFGVGMSTHCYHLDALKPYPAIDAVVIDLHHFGGIEPTIELIVRIAAHGRRVWLRSMWELGLSWAAMCHLGMTRPELDRPGQSLIDWVADDLVLGDTWHLRQGGVRPPDRPGLGVELDRDALAKYAVG